MEAGMGKLTDPAWVGSSAGAAMTGFAKGAIAKATGVHPAVEAWYAAFLQNVVIPNAVPWGYLITAGEILVGAALILGFLVGVSAFFGVFMNFNFLFAGTTSANPRMVLMGLALMLAWRVAGYYGLDRYALPVVQKYLGPRHEWS